MEAADRELLQQLEEASAQLVMFLDAGAAQRPDAAAEARLLQRELERVGDHIQRPGGQVALIGPPGVGKSSLLTVLAGLYTGERPRTPDALRAGALVTIGAGRSTAFPVSVRAPLPGEPPDQLALVIEPMSPRARQLLVEDVATLELYTRSGVRSEGPDSRPDPVGEELRRAVLNASGYGERTEIYQDGNLRRTRKIRPLDEVVRPGLSPAELTALLESRLGERARDRWAFPDTPEGRAALRALFARVNLGEEPGAALPERLVLVVPALAAGEAPLTLADTRGLDGNLPARADLRELLEDPLTVPVLCGAFPNAPSEDLRVALRALQADPALGEALMRARVLLLDKGEAAAMVGAEGDRELGQAIRLDECWARLEADGLAESLKRDWLLAFDPLVDDAEALLARLRGLAADMRRRVRARAEGLLGRVRGLTTTDEAQQALNAALDELLEQTLRANLPTGDAPALEPAASMVAALRACPYGLRIRAALRWQGEFRNLHLLDTAGAAAREAARGWLAPTQDALLRRLKSPELQARFRVELLEERQWALRIAFQRTTLDYASAVQDELRQRLQAEPLWDQAVQEYTRGPGFRERAAAVLEAWAARQPFRAHRETRLAEHLPLYARVQAPEDAPGFTLIAQNFRRLREVRWPVQGVNLLIGANGAGKSTVLTALRFFSEALREGPGAALARLGSARTLRSWGAPPDAPVVLALEVGATRWQFTLLPRDSERAPEWREELTHRGEEVLSVNEAGRFTYRGDVAGLLGPECGLAHLLRQNKADLPLTRLARLVQGLRSHRVPNLHLIKAGGTPPLPERPLEPDGGNTLAVLHQLLGAPGQQDRYRFVLDSLRLAFPKLVEELGFRPTEHSVEVSVTAPGGHPPLYIGQQADGLLQFLVNVVAVVSADSGGVVALDQPEDGLHPFAARTLLARLEDWAWQQRVTVLLATHSLVLLNGMGGAPERVYIMKDTEGQTPAPTPLTTLYDEDWLRGYALGDLYMNQNLGSNADGG